MHKHETTERSRNLNIKLLGLKATKKHKSQKALKSVPEYSACVKFWMLARIDNHCVTLGFFLFCIFLFSHFKISPRAGKSKTHEVPTIKD